MDIRKTRELRVSAVQCAEGRRWAMSYKPFSIIDWTINPDGLHALVEFSWHEDSVSDRTHAWRRYYWLHTEKSSIGILVDIEASLHTAMAHAKTFPGLMRGVMSHDTRVSDALDELMREAKAQERKDNAQCLNITT